MRKLVSAALSVLFAALSIAAVAQTAAQKKSSAKKGTATSAAHKKSAKKGPVRRTATWRTRQLTPTPERYKEIQHALATKGYLSPDQANGTWGDSSTEALRKFQADQNLDGNGKINSLSLIALGLGPKHDSGTGPRPAIDQPR